MAGVPLIIDMKCACGAHLSVECNAFSVYINAATLLELAKAWTEAHRPCHGASPAKPKD